METKLGPIQQAWIADLRANPGKQITGTLATKKEDGTVGACCLGQALITICRLEGMDEPWIKRVVFDREDLRDGMEGDFDTKVLKSYKKLGLKSSNGVFDTTSDIQPQPAKVGDKEYLCLTEMNDKGMTWLEIADFIEANPDLVFNKFV